MADDGQDDRQNDNQDDDPIYVLPDNSDEYCGGTLAYLVYRGFDPREAPRTHRAFTALAAPHLSKPHVSYLASLCTMWIRDAPAYLDLKPEIVSKLPLRFACFMANEFLLTVVTNHTNPVTVCREIFFAPLMRGDDVNVVNNAEKQVTDRVAAFVTDELYWALVEDKLMTESQVGFTPVKAAEKE